MPIRDLKKRNKTKSPIDWRNIERRMEATRIALEHEPTPGEIGRTLKIRAQAPAHASVPVKATSEDLVVIEFTLDYKRYAIESHYVREVCRLDNLTPLPCTPAFVLGIVNLRGEILSVIDIKAFFDLPKKGLSDFNKMIVLQSRDMVFGILVDEITGTDRIPLVRIQASPPTRTSIQMDYLRGVTSDHVVVLNAQQILADKKIVVREQVAASVCSGIV